MSVLGAAWAGVREQYRLGFALFLIAPLAIALIVMPEFAQHVAEIRLGMFDSRDAARALSNDPTRWAFGYAKLTGLGLAFLACARAAWAARHGGRWYDLREIAWGRFVVGLILFIAIGSLSRPLDGVLAPTAKTILELVLSVASVPFLFILLAGLFGDRTTSWRGLLTRCWPAVALLVLLMLTGFGIMQALHLGNHLLALGRPAVVVWALMSWDALVVGALAALTGAAFALAYDTARRRAVGDGSAHAR